MIVEPGRRGQSSVHEEAQTPLYMLFGITGVVLLVVVVLLLTGRL